MGDDDAGARPGSRGDEASATYEHLALEAAQMGTWDWDLVTDAVTWSPIHEALWGFAPGTFPGTAAAFLDRVHPDDRARLARTGEQALARREPFRLTYRVVRPDGRLVWVESYGRHVVDAEGRATRIRGVAIDVTDHRLLEEAERTQRELAIALASTSDLAEGLGLCLAAALRYSGLELGGVYLRDEATGALDLAAHQGLNDALLASTSHYPAGSRNAALVAANEPMYIRPAERADLPSSAPAGDVIRFVAAVPMTGVRGPVGCLNLASRRVDDVPQRVREGLEAIAATAASAIARLRGQAALREREELFATLASQAMDAVAIVDDATARFVEFNAAAHEGLGYTREEFARLTVRDIQAEHSPAEIRANIDRLVNDGRFAFETRHRCKDGSLRDVDVRGRNVVIRGRAYGAVVWTDVTERRRVERELAESEASFRALVDAAPEGIFVSRAGRFVFANPAMARLVGAPAGADLEGRDVLDVIAPEHRDVVRGAMAEVAATGRNGAPIEHEWVRLDGTRFVAEGQGVGLRFHGAEADLVFVRDRTAQREAAAEQDKLRAQLQHAQKMESIGRLAGGVAHDFNNLLMVQLGQCELLREDLRDDDPLAEGLAEIETAAQRAAALTRQLLAFSRKQPRRLETIDVNELLQGLGKMLARLIGEDVRLAFHPAPDAVTVKADAGQLEQVIVNLAVNARDAMPGGGRLTIEVAAVELDEGYARVRAEVTPGRYVRVAVSDTGHGMDHETTQRIFEPFFTTKERGKGTGLGLATVYGIVKQSGGHIEVYSEVGHGTTFKVYLPRTDGAAQARAPKPERAPRGRGEVVLVVEDDPALRDLVVRQLTTLGYETVAAEGAGDAVLRVEEQHLRPHAILTDVVMPGLDGRRLVDRIRRTLPELPAVYMSGYTENAIVHHGVLDDGVRHLQKPFSMGDLAVTLRSALAPR